MKGLVSFHPVDLALFDELVTPLVAGRKVNPAGFQDDSVRVRRNAWHAHRTVVALETFLEDARPPEVAPGAGLLGNLKARLERLDWKPDALTIKVLERVEPELHLEGRPFFVTEGSAERVAQIVEDFRTASTGEAAEALALEQLVRLDRDIARSIRAADPPEPSPEFTFRRDLLGELKALFDLARAARLGESWREGDEPARAASAVLESELPWRALRAHARVVPFWIASDVDGLDAVCRAAGIDPPPFLVPAWRPFGAACEEFPGLRSRLATDLHGERSVGAFVAPADVPELLAFLATHGAAVIREAARHDEGPACALLLRKIRECATYAERRGFGYVEAMGIRPPHLADA